MQIINFNNRKIIKAIVKETDYANMGEQFNPEKNLILYSTIKEVEIVNWISGKIIKKFQKGEIFLRTSGIYAYCKSKEN